MDERAARLFIAIDLPAEVKASLAAMQARLKNGCRFVDAHPKWVAMDNLHLTLIFLGATPETKIPVVKEQMDRAVSEVEPFELQVSRVGLFPPDSKNPKVLSVDVSSEDKALKRLYKKTFEELNKAGFELQDRPYRPHLTLARLTSVKTASRVAPIVASHADLLDVKFPVNEIVLFESLIRQEGPTYTALHRAVF